MSPLGEIADHVGDGPTIVEEDARAFENVIRQDDDDASSCPESRRQLVEGGGVSRVGEGAGGEDDGVNLVRMEGTHVAELLFWIAIGAGNEQSIVVGMDAVFEPLDDFSEVGIRDVVHDDTHGLRPGGDQGTSQPVGLEGECVCRRKHPLAGPLTHRMVRSRHHA